MKKPADSKELELIYDRGTIKVIACACMIIVLAVICNGVVNYWITRTAVVDKLKAYDLVRIVDSMSAKIDSRIERGKETALLLARDPVVVDWLKDAEQDERLGSYSRQKIVDLTKQYDYSAAFLVSVITGNYWAENGKIIHKMNDSELNDRWFFNALRFGKPIEVSLEFDNSRQERFVFVNALIGDPAQPIGVAGIGIGLQDLEVEFEQYKVGESSNLWLVNDKGEIYLSDNMKDQGRRLDQLLPETMARQIIESGDGRAVRTFEYDNRLRETMDVVCQPTASTDWKIVFQTPRRDNTMILDQIKINTLLAGGFILLVMIFVFYLISNRIANPLQRALALTQEMTKQVDVRTRELAEKNREVLDSIEYAQKLQRAMLIEPEELRRIFADAFVLWQPCDLVGGDFYWVRQVNGKAYVAVLDCTGHGVPGAFMTMMANAVLNGLIDQNYTEPADILAEMNRRVKKTLHRSKHNEVTDDGLDIGLCRIDGRQVAYAGAKLPLYIKRGNAIEILRGDRFSIGYRSSDEDLHFTAQHWDADPEDQFYLTSDGYLDQNGGEKNYSFGRKRFLQIIMEDDKMDMIEKKDKFERNLQTYRREAAQRDDITVLGFRLR